MKGIYKITNLINNKVYIGKSEVSIEQRWEAELKYGLNEHFNRSVKKYGIENFKFEIIIETEENINELEKKFIKEYKSYDPNFGYNKTFGGDGVIPTEEIRKKKSDSMKKYIPWNKGIKTGPVSEETCAKRSVSMMGKNTGSKSEKHRKKIAKSKTGTHASEETCAKRSVSMMGKNTGPKSEEHRKKLSEARKGKSPWNKGQKLSDELKEILSEAHRGIRNDYKEIECPYCGKKGRGGSMKRWHFDNCRMKETV